MLVSPFWIFLEGRILVLLKEIITIKHLKGSINSFSLSFIFVSYHLTTWYSVNVCWLPIHNLIPYIYSLLCVLIIAYVYIVLYIYFLQNISANILFWFWQSVGHIVEQMESYFTKKEAKEGLRDVMLLTKATKWNANPNLTPKLCLAFFGAELSEDMKASQPSSCQWSPAQTQCCSCH